jgi:hypothetical protein
MQRAYAPAKVSNEDVPYGCIAAKTGIVDGLLYGKSLA